MTIGIHAFAVWALIGVVGFNLAQLLAADNIYRYAKKMRIMMPVSSSLIAAVIFTGAVMMAAKHLSFTAQNIAMIVFSVVLIVLEAKRYKLLKATDAREEDAMAAYRRTGLRILGAELVWSLAITAWMLLP